jgi:hypothetical protein
MLLGRLGGVEGQLRPPQALVGHPSGNRKGRAPSAALPLFGPVWGSVGAPPLT